MGVMAIPHLAFIAWLVAADRAMRTQRAIELARLRDLATTIPIRAITAV